MLPPVAIRIAAVTAVAILAVAALLFGLNLILAWTTEHPIRAMGVFMALLGSLVLFGRRQVGRHSPVLGAFFVCIGAAMVLLG